MDKRKKSIFEWTCVILIAALIAIIIVQIFIFTSKKQREDDLKNKIDDIPEISESETYNERDLIEPSDNSQYKIVINKI